MFTNSISLSNFVGVSTILTPAGLPQFNANIIGFFTTEGFINGNQNDVYRQYLGIDSVIQDFGTNSETARLASKIFSQAPNILTGGGFLRIIPMLNSVSATQTKFETADLTANFADIKLVNDGLLKITVDGVEFNLTALNFTKCANWRQVADVILYYVKGYLNVNVLEIGGIASGLVFTSKKVGTGSQILIEQLAGTGTDLSATGYLDITDGTLTQGEASSGETLKDAIARVSNEGVSYIGFFTNLVMEDSKILEVASDTQPKQRMFMHEITSIVDIQDGGIAKQIVQGGYKKTRLLGHLQDLATAQDFKAGYTGRMFSSNFSGTGTALTANLKQLQGVAFDTILNDNLLAQFKQAGVDTYGNIAVIGYTNGQGSANDYFDNIYNAIAFTGIMQVNIFNTLQATTTKIPQTESGLVVIRDTIIKTCESFRVNGVLGTGEWLGVTPTGINPDLFKNNINNFSYYIYNLPIASQSQADRNERKAPLFQVFGKLAGAVHSVDIQLTLER